MADFESSVLDLELDTSTEKNAPQGEAYSRSTFTLEGGTIVETTVTDPKAQKKTDQVILDSENAVVEVGPGSALSVGDMAKAGLVFTLAALAVLLLAAALRLWQFNLESAFMDETSNIITGRIFLEQGKVYANVLEWSFGSMLYPLLTGWLDQQGGLVLARFSSLFFGMVTVFSTMWLTLGLFKKYSTTRDQARADFALGSRPVMAALVAGVIVAVMPSAIALSRFATYDAQAAGLFATGCAAYVWARRCGNLSQLKGISFTWQSVTFYLLAASCFFLAFLTKYVVGLFFPPLCLLVLLFKTGRRPGLWGFVAPLSIACAIYYALFRDQLISLLRYGSQYRDLRVDNWWDIYLFQRLDMVFLLLLAYSGLRQAMRENKSAGAFLLWSGALIILTFQVVARPDYDYWKHAIYLIIFLAPLAAWQVTHWSWWDEGQTARPGRLVLLWRKYKQEQLTEQSRVTLSGFENWFGGTTLTERPASYSLLGVIIAVLALLGVVWFEGEAVTLNSHWPSVTPAVDKIEQFSEGAGKVLLDDSALIYYLYGRVSTENIVTPFFLSYNGLTGKADDQPEAYLGAVRDKQFNLIILDGGVSPAGKTIWNRVRPAIGEIEDYQLIYTLPLDSSRLSEPHSLEIYRLFSKSELAALKAKNGGKLPSTLSNSGRKLPSALFNSGATVTPATLTPAPSSGQVTTAPAPSSGKATTAPAPTNKPSTTRTAPLPMVSPRTNPTPVLTLAPLPAYPANASYDFAEGDEGWGALPQNGELEPGRAVSSTDTYKLEKHNSLRFTPQVDAKVYTVGVNRPGTLRKVSLYVFVPAEKTGGEVKVGLYYFDKKWNWNDDGFNGKLVPGQWTSLSWELPEAVDITQLGLKLIGFSGSIYLNGVVVE